MTTARLGGRSPRSRIDALAIAGLGIAAVVALAVAAAACGSGTGDGSAPLDERIVLVRDQRLLVRGDDGKERELYRAEQSNVFPAFPAWSPDGTRIAFVQSTFAVSADGDWGDLIAVLDGSGGELTVIWTHTQRGQQIQGLAWTADGAELIAGVVTPDPAAAGTAAVSDRGLHRIDLATGQSRLLVAGAVEPSLSADGSRLAFLAPGAADAAAIWVADADGSNTRMLPLPPNFEPPFAPRISRDGGSVAFAAATNGAFSARPARGRTALSRTLPFAPRRAEASPVLASHGVPMEVWRIEIATEALTPLTSFAEDDPRSAWEPDGTALIVLGTGGLYRVATDGSGVERLDDGAFAGQLDVR